MAKDGDIIDYMFSSIVSLIGWIIGGIIKLAFAIIGGLFSALLGLFKNKKTEV